MDHEAFAQLLGNYGEFVGAIAVVITLGFLTLQIRQSSKTAKSNAAQAVLHAISDQYRAAASSRDLAHIVEGGILGFSDLDQTERTQFLFWLFSWFRLMEQAFDHYEEGNIPKDTWMGQFEHLKSYFAAPAVNHFWNLRQSFFSPRFRDLIDSIDRNHESEAPDVVKGLATFRND